MKKICIGLEWVSLIPDPILTTLTGMVAGFLVASLIFLQAWSYSLSEKTPFNKEVKA